MPVPDATDGSYRCDCCDMQTTDPAPFHTRLRFIQPSTNLVFNLWLCSDCTQTKLNEFDSVVEGTPIYTIINNVAISE